MKSLTTEFFQILYILLQKKYCSPIIGKFQVSQRILTSSIL